MEKLSTDAVTRDIKVDSYGQVIQFVSGSLRETAKAKRETEARRAEIGPAIEASARSLEELRSLTALEETTVRVVLKGKQNGTADLSLTYATPGATWEPMHELRATSDGLKEVDLQSYAVVTQTTGEDWSGANLTFSTQSFSQAEQIPKLAMLSLGDTPATPRTVSRSVTSFSQAEERFAAQNERWNLMNQAQSREASMLRRFEQRYATNMESFARAKSETVRIFGGLQDRGTTVHFSAAEPVSLRSDGQSIRVPIGRSQLRADTQIMAAAEESLNAAVTLDMKNTGAQPLLPGKVARYRDSAFLGMTDIDFVAAGEDFSVFFRAADHIKLSRVLDKKQSSLVRRERHQMQLSFVTTVENLSDQPTQLNVAERIPVSEDRDIVVSRISVLPAQKADDNGIVHWTIALKPHESRQIRVSYQVDYPPSLVLDVQRKRMSSPMPAPAEAPAPARELADDIAEFEAGM